MNKPLRPDETEAVDDRPGRVRAFWNWLTRTGASRGAQPLSPSDLRLTRTTFRDALAGTGGEASARQRVATLASLYRGLNDDGRRSFLGLLAEEFGPDELTVNRAIQGYLDANGPGRRAAESRLPPRARRARASVLASSSTCCPTASSSSSTCAPTCSAYLHGQAPRSRCSTSRAGRALSSAGSTSAFLELQRISWQSPAALLEKLMTYEAVHEIRVLDRSAEPARHGPPLLRVLPSAHARTSR